MGDFSRSLRRLQGGENVTTTVEGRDRYPVNVRYSRDLRSDLDKLQRVLVPVMNSQAQIPVSQLATVELSAGPSMIRDENGLLDGYVYVDIAGRDIGGYVQDAKKPLREKVNLPPGYTLTGAGSTSLWNVFASV